jgi:hypothetical protein
MNNIRTTEDTSVPDVKYYKLSHGAQYDKEVEGLLDEYTHAWETPWMEVVEKIKTRIRELSKTGGRWQKNILMNSSKADAIIWKWKDSKVFALKSRYAYKESTKVAWAENVLYLRRKYDILKTYLGDIVPQSRFVLWQVNKGHQFIPWMANVEIPERKAITLQRLVGGRDLSKMSLEEKSDLDFLKKLEKSHQRYILLKFFVKNRTEELWLSPETLDVKMDLGGLSDVEHLNIENLDVQNRLDSPNIMYDGESVYFVDLDSWVWDEKKEEVYQYLMNPEIIQRWDEIMWNMGLID